jgi:FKBP-type peptidyl-prolyl cis-trans isomerase
MPGTVRRYAVILLLPLALMAGALSSRPAQAAAPKAKAAPTQKTEAQKLKPSQEDAAVKAARKLGTTTIKPAYKLPDGLTYIDVKEGKGAAAQAGRPVEVHYTGWLVNGQKFDSSKDRGQPFSFPLGARRVIKGWDEGVAGMKPGGVRKLIIPADLAYGSRAVGPIPPNSTLIFEVELLRAP